MIYHAASVCCVAQAAAWSDLINCCLVRRFRFLGRKQALFASTSAVVAVAVAVDVRFRRGPEASFESAALNQQAAAFEPAQSRRDLLAGVAAKPLAAAPAKDKQPKCEKYDISARLAIVLAADGSPAAAVGS